MSTLPGQFQVALSARWGEFAAISIWSMLVLFFVYLACIPVQYHDTDMFYHLAGGRYFVETGEVYNPYVASFLTPAQPFINYFWGFQVSAFGIWSLAGDPGLIFYKAILLGLTAFFATKVILMDQPFRQAGALQLVAIALVIGFLCARSISLRPHLFSYLFIALFIYILMFRVKWYPVLPLLTIIWANFHGVEYVVGALICGAFFLERVFHWKKSGDDPRALKPLAWILLCAPAMLVNVN